MGEKCQHVVFLVEESQENRVWYWACNIEYNLYILPPDILQSEGAGQITLDQTVTAANCLAAPTAFWQAQAVRIQYPQQ